MYLLANIFEKTKLKWNNLQYDTFQRSICLPENNARYGPVEKKNLTQAIPKLKTTLLQNIFWSFFCNEIVRAFSFDCDTCHAKSKKKNKKVRKELQEKNYKKKRFYPSGLSVCTLFWSQKLWSDLSLKLMMMILA